MRYTKETFARELEELLPNSNSDIEHQKIAEWAYETRTQNLQDIDGDVSKWLIALGAMTMGPEFEFSRDELKAMVVAARQT